MEDMQQVDNIIAALRQETAVAADDISMQLTSAEVARAKEIKTAMEALPELPNLSDFEVVQFALTCPGMSLEQACDKMSRFHSFRREYRIEDTARDGVQRFHHMTLQHPGLVLALEYLPSSSNYIAVHDYAAFFPPKTEEETHVLFQGLFYLDQAKFPNFQSIRVGYTCLIECSGAGYANFDADFCQKFVVELFNSYPLNQKEVYYINSESTMSMMTALWNRFVPERVRNKWVLGFQIPGFEGQRIDVLYKTPTEEEARGRTVLQLLKNLLLRYTNQQNFSLSNPSIIGAAAR